MARRLAPSYGLIMNVGMALIALSVAIIVLGPSPLLNVMGWWNSSAQQQQQLEAQLSGSLAGQQLLTLPVRTLEGVADLPDYKREAFGERWADVDHNGCDTRNDVLKRDLARPTFKARTNNCVVTSGTLAEPYGGNVVEFQRGEKTSELVQIDHVVALADAWVSGAWKWDAQTRQRFANDPRNLLAVDGKLNNDKGSSSADLWLPPNSEFHCQYVATQVAVKFEWGLSITVTEKEKMAFVLATCPQGGRK